jgi:hypothetical protein
VIARSLSLCAAVLFAVACDRERSTEPAATAKFGVFFGGQIQEREEIPFELDPTKQTQGFRIELGAPAPGALPVHWEIARPDPEGNSRFVTVLGDGALPAGQNRFEQALRFKPGDALGLWNVRVVLDNRVLIDRPFTVYDHRIRQRLLEEDGGS